MSTIRSFSVAMLISALGLSFIASETQAADLATGKKPTAQNTSAQGKTADKKAEKSADKVAEDKEDEGKTRSSIDHGMLVTLDRAQVIKLTTPAATVIVGNPLVADVSIQDSKTLIITGKSYGQTNVIIVDNKGNPILERLVKVRLADEDMVTVQRNTARSTYACHPSCQPTLVIGDNVDGFSAVNGQIAGRNGVSQQSAGGGN